VATSAHCPRRVGLTAGGRCLRLFQGVELPEACGRTRAHATFSSNGSAVCRPKEYRAPATKRKARFPRRIFAEPGLQLLGHLPCC
jgi:hypothetical protein